MSTLGDMLKYLPPRLAEAIAEECGRLGADDGAGGEDGARRLRHALLRRRTYIGRAAPQGEIIWAA